MTKPGYQSYYDAVADALGARLTALGYAEAERCRMDGLAREYMEVLLNRHGGRQHGEAQGT